MYSRYQNLLFFDKNGKSIDFKFENEIWKGKIYVPKFPVNLYETVTLYISEQFLDSDTNVVYSYPHLASPATNNNVKCNLKTGNRFRFFTIDNPQSQEPYISFLENMEFEFRDWFSDSVDMESGSITTTNFDYKFLKIDLCVSAVNEEIIEDTLILYDEKGKIFEIDLYAESEGEDERFVTLLSNIGEQFFEKDEFIFKESNINEDLPNYHIINRKRKELLMEFHNLRPYLSSYRGIINIIKFFGYYNVKLKEYFLNTETGKLFYEDVVLDEYDRLDKKSHIKSKPYKKTSNFGLFYDINRVIEDEYDELGLPVLEETSHFTFDEVILKLFGLQNYIRDNGIGGMARIMDLIGEQTNFVRYDINYWHDRTQTFTVELGNNIDFKTDIEQGYIVDLRPLMNDYTNCQLPRYLDQLNGNYQIGSYANCFVGWFDNLHMENPEYLDDRNIPVGCPVVLENTSFNVAWENLTFTWNQTVSHSNITLNWDTITHSSFYEIEWEVNRNQVTSLDTRYWHYQTRGKVNDLKTHGIIIPYDGYYDVTLRLIAWNNNNLKLTKKSHIEILLKESDFISFFRIKENTLQRFRGNYLMWGEIKSEWGNPVFDNEQFLIGENDIQDRSYHVVNFIDSNALDVPYAGINSETWDSFFGNLWLDFSYVTWTDFTYVREKLARFQITEITSGGYIQIGKDSIVLPDNLNVEDFGTVANILNEEIRDDIGNFDYLARTIDGSSWFVDATSLDYGHTGNKLVGASRGCKIGTTDTEYLEYWKDLHYPWQDIIMAWECFPNVKWAKGLDNLFTWDNVNIFKDSFYIPVCVRCQMVVDNSGMAGKTNIFWSIKNDDTGEILVEKYNIFSIAFRFVEVGYYTVTCLIEDTNGNKKSVTKNRHIRVIDTNEYHDLKIINKVLKDKKRQSVFDTVEFIKETAN